MQRIEIIEKILSYMKEYNYKDEDTYISLKLQSYSNNITNYEQESLHSYRKQIRDTNEFSNLFDEIEIRNVRKGDICCITQMKIFEKFENVCGHIYERSAVINNNKQKISKCPAIGCNFKIREKKQ